MKIAMLVYPGMTPLDMVGPLQTWSMLPEVEIQLVWKNTDPVTTDTGMAIVPTHAYADAFEQPDILFCGGGVKPTIDLMQDAETIQFLKDRGQRAQWVTSVCTGALLLGAAGLLNGYKATTHWAAVPMLESFGAIPTAGRYRDLRDAVESAVKVSERWPTVSSAERQRWVELLNTLV